MRCHWPLAVAFLVVGAPLRAQCPDGTPPPCAAPAARSAREPARAPDPNRIAVLPFRVTTADTLLGEGFAELLATEFTGEGSPRAVDMATVLSAWRRAGGGLRTPLPRAEAVRVARELGAGLVSEGSIVGLGGRVTVTANLISVPDGGARGNTTRVSGSPDSLDALLRQAAAGLLAAVGGERRASEGARFTDSPTAMRFYLEGLSAWRRGRLTDAAEAFDHAIAEDSSFAQAMFRRYLAAGWGMPGDAPYARLTWERRARLSPRERTVLEGVLGAQYPQPRLVEERLAGRQRAADQLPDSPDALYFIGDYYYHYGAPIDPANQLRLAKEYFERSAAIDSQATVLRHLLEIGLWTQDTALLRRVWPAYDRTEDLGRWLGGWLVAASLGDQAALAALRRRPLDPGSSVFAGGWALNTAVGANVPARLFDEMVARHQANFVQPETRAGVLFFEGVILVFRGRPLAAQRMWGGIQPEDIRMHQAVLRLALSGAGTALDIERSVERLAGFRGDSAIEATSACLVALWRAQRGDTARVDVERFRRFDRRCAWGIELQQAARLSGPEGDRRMAESDSALRNSMAFDISGFEGPLLAGAWEARGDLRRALAAIRLRLYGSAQSEAVGWREEGRLAAMAGDTAGAIRALRTYLVIHQDAEAPLIPQRDSVRAELTRLEAARH